MKDIYLNTLTKWFSCSSLVNTCQNSLGSFNKVLWAHFVLIAGVHQQLSQPAADRGGCVLRRPAHRSPWPEQQPSADVITRPAWMEKACLSGPQVNAKNPTQTRTFSPWEFATCNVSSCSLGVFSPHEQKNIVHFRLWKISMKQDCQSFCTAAEILGIVIVIWNGCWKSAWHTLPDQWSGKSICSSSNNPPVGHSDGQWCCSRRWCQSIGLLSVGFCNPLHDVQFCQLWTLSAPECWISFFTFSHRCDTPLSVRGKFLSSLHYDEFRCGDYNVNFHRALATALILFFTMLLLMTLILFLYKCRHKVGCTMQKGDTNAKGWISIVAVRDKAQFFHSNVALSETQCSMRKFIFLPRRPSSQVIRPTCPGAQVGDAQIYVVTSMRLKHEASLLCCLSGVSVLLRQGGGQIPSNVQHSGSGGRPLRETPQQRARRGRRGLWETQQ